MQVPDTTEDETLMLQYAGGQIAAFNALYARHARRVWRYLYRSVNNPSQADDLMQEVWFSVARSAPGYTAGRNGAKFTTWLFTMAHNRLVDYVRSAKAQGANSTWQSSEDDGDMERAQGIADSGFGPLRQIESRQQARALVAAIDALPFEQREAFLLQAEGGMDVQEIAQAVGVSFETAKSRLRYARSKLKILLADFAELKQ